MATYKVLQDIEAEDKLLGPLTLRQFIYAGVCAGTLYLCFVLATKGAIYLTPVFLPLAAVSGFFAWPFAGEQPTEVWALAKIRFLIKPRKRIWDQSGAKELVTITVPKKVEINYTNGLSETEVKSRLQALADTIDSRGWAVKNVNVNLSSQPALVMGEPSSDRLVSPESLPKEVISNDVQAADDMLDPQNNPVAQQFDTMIAAATRAHREKIMENLRQATMTGDAKAQAARLTPPVKAASAPPAQPAALPPANYWFMNQPAAASQQVGGPPQGAVTFNAQVVAPGAPIQPAVPNPTPDEEELVHELAVQQRAEHIPYGHLHTIQPLSAQKQQQQAVAAAQAEVQKSIKPKVTPDGDAAILNLARNDDLNVATIAREAHKQRPEPPQDEIVISLH